MPWVTPDNMMPICNIVIFLSVFSFLTWECPKTPHTTDTAVKVMCQNCSTVTFQSSLSLYQCTLLPICTVATVQLLYAIPILTVTISVHTDTNMYGSHSCYSHVPVLRYIYCIKCGEFVDLLRNCQLLQGV